MKPYFTVQIALSLLASTTAYAQQAQSDQQARQQGGSAAARRRQARPSGGLAACPNWGQTRTWPAGQWTFVKRQEPNLRWTSSFVTARYGGGRAT